MGGIGPTIRSRPLVSCFPTRALLTSVVPQAAKAYQVDCAILLCLAAGWPASAECAHARAVFIRRITPWPIEPPLQIWRCPMGASMSGPLQNTAPRVWEVSSQSSQTLGQIILAQMVEGGADIDISGLEFDFVRCRYAVTRETFPLTSQTWEEGDVHEQGSTRDST